MHLAHAPRPAALGLLTVLVLAAHWLVLLGLPLTLGIAGSTPGPRFALRALASPPPTLAHASKPSAPPSVVRPSIPSGRGPTQPRAVAEPAPPRAHGAPGPGLPKLSRPGAFAVPASVRIEYDVTGNARGQSYQARSQLLWQQDGQRYEARLELGNATPRSRTQTSSGLVTADGLAPTRFSDKTRSEQATHFEREQGRIVFSANAPSAPLLAGTQDRLSVLFQLAALVGGDPQRYAMGTRVAIPIAGTRDLDPWMFSVSAVETLSLPGGEVATLKLTREPLREYDQRVELWLAPVLGYLPVRWRWTQANGDWVDQQWRSSLGP